MKDVSISIEPRPAPDPDYVVFDVVLVVDKSAAPRVSVKPAPGHRGVVDVTGVEERGRDGDARTVVFTCEATRDAVPWEVAVLVQTGLPGQAQTTTLPGPTVPARAP